MWATMMLIIVQLRALSQPKTEKNKKTKNRIDPNKKYF